AKNIALDQWRAIVAADRGAEPACRLRVVLENVPADDGAGAVDGNASAERRCRATDREAHDRCRSIDVERRAAVDLDFRDRRPGRATKLYCLGSKIQILRVRPRRNKDTVAVAGRVNCRLNCGIVRRHVSHNGLSWRNAGNERTYTKNP